MDWIKPEEMSPMKPIVVKARDGLPLHGYITIPKNSNGKNLPLIINPHGGPHGPRDEWGFNPEVQLFANRGYAVLQINYRCSCGYGNAFEGMGYRKWGTTMQDDLTDSVKWAIAQGIADPDRVCIYGASYGGYAALMSVVREPDLYRCTVGYVGVYDLDAQRDADFMGHESGRNYLKDVYPPTAAERMAEVLGSVEGVGKVRVMLTLRSGETLSLAEDSSSALGSGGDVRQDSQVLTVNRGSGRQEVVVTKRMYPTYQGAVVVCQGAGNSRVRLQVMETVAVLTGLSSERISVVQWKQ